MITVEELKEKFPVRHLFERHIPRRPPLPGQKTLVAAPTLEASS